MEMFAEECRSTRTMAHRSSAHVDVNDPNEASEADVDIVRVDVGGAEDGAKEAAKRAADVPIKAGNLSVVFERENLNTDIRAVFGWGEAVPPPRPPQALVVVDVTDI
jgi:hypothetical protein